MEDITSNYWETFVDVISTNEKFQNNNVKNIREIWEKLEIIKKKFKQPLKNFRDITWNSWETCAYLWYEHSRQHPTIKPDRCATQNNVKEE